MDTLSLHEQGTVKLMLDSQSVDSARIKFARMVGDHHGYDTTQKYFASDERFQALALSREEEKMIMLLRLFDVCAALGQTGRPYFGGRAKTLGQVRGILDHEAEGGKLDPTMVTEFSEKLLAGPPGSTDVLETVANNAARLAA